MHTGTLYLIKSKNPPVFKTPLRINYMVPPKEGQAFLFTKYDGCGMCSLSTVQAIWIDDGFTKIKTRNSLYVLLELHPGD